MIVSTRSGSSRERSLLISLRAAENRCSDGGGRNRQILLRETCSISIGLVVGIRLPPLHSVACLCSRSRDSQVAIEFGLGRLIRGDAGRYKLQ